MAGPLNAKVILAKCTKNKQPYGIRIEQRGGDWVRTWAFKIDEYKAKNEGFTANTVSGSMNAVDNYPGCPHCGCVSFCQCGYCQKIGCCDSTATHYTCPWCGNGGSLTAVECIDVSGGGY